MVELNRAYFLHVEQILSTKKEATAAYLLAYNWPSVVTGYFSALLHSDSVPMAKCTSPTS